MTVQVASPSADLVMLAAAAAVVGLAGGAAVRPARRRARWPGRLAAAALAVVVLHGAVRVVTSLMGPASRM